MVSNFYLPVLFFLFSCSRTFPMPCAARAALAASRSASRRPHMALIQMIMATVTTILRGSSKVLAPRRERGEKSKCVELLLLLTVLNS